MIIKDDEIVNKIFDQSGRKFSNTTSWIKRENNFNFYIFSTCCRDEIELLEIYEGLNNDIALYFQTGLQKYPEIWNIYIFFFVTEPISVTSKYLVEQDKYCSRKLVFDGQAALINESYIIKTINGKLFNLSLDFKGRIGEDGDNGSSTTIEEIIASNSLEVLNLIRLVSNRDNKKDKQAEIEKFLKESLNEQ
ncbi:ABC-three component system middle component 1 [Paenibacillus lupini]|uniref:ABC-three component system middle component 1 n=1 Tax=Paenibacillus lupini TaxID=1450204 RepID=UPI0014236391|nr:ABC-three component system middle component 1 [Paenibacillus lupini]NIK24980.1 hypothetical protein [Paenibacillus lupini]